MGVLKPILSEFSYKNTYQYLIKPDFQFGNIDYRVGIVFSLYNATSDSWNFITQILTMTKFLNTYRGAEIYEVEEFDSSEVVKMGSKLIAKAMLPDQQNMKVDFAEEAATQEKAREKIKKAIDRYLDEHDIDKFEMKN